MQKNRVKTRKAIFDCKYRIKIIYIKIIYKSLLNHKNFDVDNINTDLL